MQEAAGWDMFDFAVAGGFLVAVVVSYLLLARIRSRRHRVLLGIVLGIALLLVWMELAVGVFGTPFAGT